MRFVEERGSGRGMDGCAQELARLQQRVRSRLRREARRPPRGGKRPNRADAASDEISDENQHREGEAMDEKAGASRAKGLEANSGPGQLVSMEGKPESPERETKPPGSGARAAGASSQPGQAGTTTPTPSATKEQQAMTQATLGERDKAIKILAKSIFRELKMNGYETRQIVALSSELLGLVTSTIKPEGDSGNG